MARALALVSLMGMGAVSGCTSYVKTYDGDMRLLGACKSGVTLFGLPLGAWGRGGCVGSANPKEQSQR